MYNTKCEVHLINVLFSGHTAFIMSSSKSAYFPSPLSVKHSPTFANLERETQNGRVLLKKSL